MGDVVHACGTGGWTGPLPGDPDNNITLSATPTFGGIDVVWSFPVINPGSVSHVIIWRNNLQNFYSAQRHATASGNQFFDKTPLGTSVEHTYFYWIQIVSVNGTVSPAVGPASSTARPTISMLMEEMTEKIDAGALAQSLKAEIGNIALLGHSITDEVAARIAANEALGDALSETQTDVDTAVAFIETLSTKQVTDNAAIVTSMTLLGAGLGDSVAGIATEVQSVAGLVDALSSWKITAESSINGNVSTGEIGLVTRVNEVGDAVDGMLSAKLSVNGLIGGFGLYNDGATVQAGFDVDNFWVGRTQANKRKPFIIDGETGETYIDNAVIHSLTLDKLRTADNSVVVENGVIRASLLDLDWDEVTGSSKPADGATRNVYRGLWTTATVYYPGDALIDGGYGWSCIQYHTSSGSIKPPTFPTVANAYWILATVKGADGVTGPTGAIGQTGNTGSTGATGATLYTWVAYANNTTGSGFTTGANTGQTYIGIANNQASATEGTSYTAYTWSLIKGTDGVQGTPGTNGVTTYTWFAYATNATGTTGFTNGTWTNQTYIGLAVNKLTTVESTNPADYSWSLIKGATGNTGLTGSTGSQGATGPQGAQGNTGAQGVQGNTGLIDTAGRYVLGGSGGLVGGNLTWDPNTGDRTGGAGVAITGKGIVGHNGTKSTLVVDATTGNATFGGDISGATGTFGGNVHGGQFTTGAYTGYAWPAVNNYGTYVGPSGLLMGNYNNGKYVQITQTGDIYTPGFNVINGTMTVNQANVINTLNIAGNAVTAVNSANGTGVVVSTTVNVPAGITGKVIGLAILGAGASSMTLTIHGVSTTISVAGIIQSDGDGHWYSYPPFTVSNIVSVTGPATVVISANAGNNGAFDTTHGPLKTVIAICTFR